MNEEIIDNQDSVELKTTRKPIHLTIVSIGAFLLISLVLIVMMDLFITAIAQNLAIAHAGIGEDVTVEPIPTYVLAVRAAAIISLVVSITIGFFGKKMYLHRPGRMLQKLIMVMVCFMVFVMFGIGIGLIVTFALFLWNPSKLADWNDKELNIYRAGFIGLILALMIGELILAIGIGGLAIFVRFFWTPKPFAENTPRMLNIFRIIFLGIIGVIIASDIFLTFGDFAVLSFVSMPLSSILTPLGAGIVSLAPGLLVIIPLYLFLPKVIRDLWNLRPNIETFWREFLYHPMGILGIIIIGTIVCIALFAPYIAPYYWSNPPGTPILLDELLQPPSPEHLLGTNHRGEDIFSRIIYGSQISLMIGFAASLVAVFLGTAVGLLSGYYGGILDTILMRITDVFLCLPTLPLMLIFLVLFGQGLQNVIIVIAILGWTGTARMVRSEALSLRERPLTEAAHALGASDGYILIQHILPNTLPLILANMILGVVSAILSEAGIAFLGFVDIHGQPSWGIVLHWAWKNAALLANKWWWFIPPGVLIMLTTLGFVFISHTADKVVNPRLRGRRK
ncbi:ABC transporter permease subunit [Candidatus Thorarchaeota archaeon]|nr:MAG: ABC transporter permease subunit [Candidatus Thorarchaeota archaeon]